MHKIYNKMRICNSVEKKSSSLEDIREGMPLTESILYRKQNEVHLGADFVKET